MQNDKYALVCIIDIAQIDRREAMLKSLRILQNWPLTWVTDRLLQFLKCGPENARRPWNLSGGPQNQNYFCNNIKVLFAFFIINLLW